MKLGEILLKKGLVTRGQLEKALSAQLIHGGHLGTALIEIGVIGEDALGKVLSEMSGVPYAPPKLFAKITKETIKAVPGKIAEQYQVVPVLLTEQAVHLALINPRNLRTLDELSFAIGRKVVPWIAPEVRIFQALERYYAVAEPSRYIRLVDRLDEVGQPSGAGAEETSKSPSAAESTPVGVTWHADVRAQEAQDLEAGYGRPWQEIAEELEKRSPAVYVPQPPESPASSMPLPELAERYCRAENRDDLAHAALDFVIGRAERMLLMLVRDGRARVWHERGLALPKETREDVSFEVTSEPLFGLLMGDDHYHGEVPKSDDVLSFFRRLRVGPPSELLLVPIRVNDLLVAMLIADGGPRGRIHGDVEEFLKAFRLFGLSLAMLALRKKIRDAAQSVRVA